MHYTEQKLPLPVDFADYFVSRVLLPSLTMRMTTDTAANQNASVFLQEGKV